jgi:hypothetical protein
MPIWQILLRAWRSLIFPTRQIREYAYMADGNSGLAVIDISDPTNPGTPVYEDTTGNARDIYISGDYAYVADDTSGLAVIDISDPTNPGTPVYYEEEVQMTFT